MQFHKHIFKKTFKNYLDYSPWSRTETQKKVFTYILLSYICQQHSTENSRIFCSLICLMKIGTDCECLVQRQVPIFAIPKIKTS